MKFPENKDLSRKSRKVHELHSVQLGSCNSWTHVHYSRKENYLWKKHEHISTKREFNHAMWYALNAVPQTSTQMSFISFSVLLPPPPFYMSCSLSYIYPSFLSHLLHLQMLDAEGWASGTTYKGTTHNTARIHINALRASTRSNMYYCSGSMSLKKNCQSSIY